MDNKRINKNIIKEIQPNSIAEELEDLEAGDAVISINDTQIEDIFDYQFLIQDEYLELLVQKKNGEEWLYEIEKDFDNSFILSMLISDNNKKRKSFLYRALGGLMQLFAPFF